MNRTNSDRIRAMTDEELAEIFVHHCTKSESAEWCSKYRKCCDCWLAWLRQECET